MPRWTVNKQREFAGLAAPRAEFALPPRSRVAAITGAATGVLIVAASAFSRAPADSCPGLRVAERRALLPAAIDPLLHRVDIDERQHVPAR